MGVSGFTSHRQIYFWVAQNTRGDLWSHVRFCWGRRGDSTEMRLFPRKRSCPHSWEHEPSPRQGAPPPAGGKVPSHHPCWQLQAEFPAVQVLRGLFGIHHRCMVIEFDLFNIFSYQTPWELTKELLSSAWTSHIDSSWRKTLHLTGLCNS